MSRSLIWIQVSVRLSLRVDQEARPELPEPRTFKVCSMEGAAGPRYLTGT